MAFWKNSRRSEPEAANEPWKNIFDSAGPMILSVGLDGLITHINPACEQMLGYHSAEVTGVMHVREILSPDESERVAASLMQIGGAEAEPVPAPEERTNAVIRVMRRMPPSQVPNVETSLRRKDGSTFPVTLQVAALRDDAGEMQGLVLVALDLTATLRQQQDTRESQERYRDLFENSSEMIATLSPGGQFLYANPAWQKCFGVEPAQFTRHGSFEDLFDAECREEVAALFRNALHGRTVERMPLRNCTRDGRVLELELSMSRRQKTGNPLAVRCLLRDVTQQKQREHRLALQLAVSQIVAENSSMASASTRVLEALCVSQGWDMAVMWEVNESEKRLEFASAWGVPNWHADELIRESMGATVERNAELAGRAWREGRTVWMHDLKAAKQDERIASALRYGMASGWAVPVRVDKRVLAIFELYNQRAMRQEPEALAAAETVTASLGQMLARTQEQGRAEELSRQREVLLDAVADGICGLDWNGMVSFANPAAARLLGAPANSLTGRPIHALLHAGRVCGPECALRRAEQEQSACSGEDTMTRADGSSFPVEYSFTPIREYGRYSGSVLSFRDISQRYALDRMKDEFIATVSHELRTPLTSIRGALGLLASGKLGASNDKAAQLTSIALNNTDRLMRLINDMLDLERLHRGGELTVFQTVQLADVMRLAVETVQPLAESAGIQLIQDTMRAEVAGDSDRLLQVMTNLLANAVKFSPKGSTVSVMMRAEVNGVTVSVIDQGRGIPKEMLETIFQRFQQVDASDARQKGGSGLGLAICRTIVEQHAGRIWAERNAVRGSTFRVFLPYQREAARVLHDAAEIQESK